MIPNFIDDVHYNMYILHLIMSSINGIFYVIVHISVDFGHSEEV